MIKQIWELIAGNDLHDPASLLGFWEELAASLPTEPGDAKVVTVRTWLVNRVADARDSVDGSRGAVSLQSYDPGVTAMLAYAALLGMPLGDQKAAPTLLVLGHTGDVVCSLSTDGDEPPQLHPLGGGGKGGG